MMHDSALHLTEDELHDAADGTNPPAESSRAARHLMHCARCRTDVERIRDLLALASALPREIEPPTDLWPDIRTRIRRTALPSTGRAAGSRSLWNSFVHDRGWLAAAAVLLIVASSVMTALFLRPNNDSVVQRPDTVEPAPGSQRAPVVRTVSDDYDRLDRELAQLLAGERGKMQPETVAKVERNLAIIDAAIAEIRQALAEDPGNDALLQLLKASYGQKSALVRQVSTS
jgi:anti-sigma factor RsiW